MASVESPNCNHCGAALEAPVGTNFVTCGYCGAHLAIRHSGGAYYTEVLEQMSADTDRMEQNLEVIRQQNELERIDREWQMRRETLRLRGKDGQASVPSSAVGIVGGILVTAFGVFWIGAAVNMYAPAIFPIFGVGFVLAAIGGTVTCCTKDAAYHEAEAKYQAQREEIFSQANGGH